MREIFDGVLHWSARYEAIGAPVSSYYVVPAGVVIDPKLPDAGLDAFGELPRPQQVVLTSGLHTRDAAAFAEAFGCPIRVSREGAERIGGRLETEPYAAGEEIASGVRALQIGVLCPDEYALHITATEPALAVADAVHTYGAGVGFFSDELLGEDAEAIKDGLRKRLVAALELDIEHLLTAHGDPVVGNAGQALREFIAGPAG